MSSTPNYQIAIQDFKRLRQQAATEQLLARLTGRSNDLLAYDDVEDKLHPTDRMEHGLQEIKVEAIVDSVGRYKDFTRTFLPKRDSDQERWARVRTAVWDMKGMPPIEVYQVGEAYFVKDGNHRVSVARQLGSSTISAFVTEVKTRVPLMADDDLDEIICKAGHADFLEQANLDKLRPEVDLLMTISGQYPLLLAQIDNYQQVPRAVAYHTAVRNWYDESYLLMAALIREQGILRDFPERTEADLYVLLTERRQELESALGWHERRLFNDILVTIRGTKRDWRTLDQAITLAQRENGRIQGFHVVGKSSQVSGPQAEELRANFERQCAAANDGSSVVSL